MKKIFSIILFLLVVGIGLYSYFSVFLIENHINTITPKYMDISSSDLMKLEKEKIAFLAESFAKDHVFLANEREKVNGMFKNLLLTLFSMLLVLSLLFLFSAFRPTKENE